jgi:hypothetical protein
MRTVEEIDDVQAKRETVVRVVGSDIEADCLNRRIGDKDSGVKLAKITLLFKDAALVEDYILQAAIKMTLIRVQDDARRTMNNEEIAGLDGTTINAQDFWGQRRDRKARAIKPMTVEKASVELGKMGATDQAKIIAALLKDRPELLELLKK